MVNDARGTDHENNVKLHLILGGVLIAMMVVKDVAAGEELFF